jgi:hypothetical protein
LLPAIGAAIVLSAIGLPKAAQEAVEPTLTAAAPVEGAAAAEPRATELHS